MTGGRFKKGNHWRSPKPWWDKAWLAEEYNTKGRSAADIAKEGGVTENAILFWLAKHAIPRRTMREIRAAKHWGADGERNPMHGKTGAANPNWRGGLTPARQAMYAKAAWRTATRKVRRRDKVCRLCGGREKTEIHHIDPFASAPLLAIDEGNLILLCGPCHKKLAGKEARWKRKLFKLIQPERT